MSYRVALAGNPNCGKTTLFNRLTGASQRVGNWPGVTIDKKEGIVRGTDMSIVDMPGIYSLSPYSPEEIVTRNYLINEHPDVILNIVDASNLERNLYLTLQIADIGVPMVVALNMMDIVEKAGDHIDVDKLQGLIGCRIVEISALKGTGMDDLINALKETGEKKTAPTPVRLSGNIESAISSIESEMKDVPDRSKRFFAIKMIEKDEVVIKEFSEDAEKVSERISELEKESDDEGDSIIADARYTAIEDIVSECMVKKERASKDTTSDKIDKIVTHRIWGIPIFICVIGAVFIGIIGYGDFTGIGTYFTDMLNDWIGNSLQPAVEQWCVDNNVSEELTGLLVNGIIGGVGAVIGFIPQMLVLFLALCILEDIGYMSRIAFIMDRVFRYFGLSGKSLIPVIVGAGCGVPGIMSTKTIESERDRRITAMTVTFMPCGAKLPVIAMIAGALFNNNGLIALFAYLLGIVCVLASGIILKKWKHFSGEPSPFVMELPPYHLPSWINVLKGTADRGVAFVKKAGTIILLSSVVLWFLASYDLSLHFIGSDSTTDSILQTFGQAVCVVFQPLGWGDNWEYTVATITGLIAKENLIATLGTLFSIEVGDSGEEIWGIIASTLTPSAGLAFLTFNLLCAPCFASMGAMHSALGSWKSTGIAIAYQCLLAYAVSSIIYVVGGWLGGSEVVVSGIVIAVISAVVLAYLLIMKDPFFQNRGEQHE